MHPVAGINNAPTPSTPPSAFMSDFKSELYYNFGERAEKYVRNLPIWKQVYDRMLFVEPETNHVVAYWDIDAQG